MIHDAVTSIGFSYTENVIQYRISTLRFEIGFHVLYRESISNPNAKPIVIPVWARFIRMHPCP